MGMRSIIQVAVVVTALVALVGLVHQIRERAKFELLAAQKQETIDALNARVKTDSLALVEVEKWAEDSLQALGEAAVEAEKEVASWRRESRRTHRELSEMVSSLPDTLQERVNSAVANLVGQHQQEVEAYERLVANLRSQNSVLDSQLTATQNLNASLHTALNEANEQIDFYKSAATPSFFKSIKSDLPKMILAFGIGYGTAKVLD